MIHTVGRKRFDALDGAIASGLVLLFLGACSSDSTSPTQTATSIVVASDHQGLDFLLAMAR